MAPGKDDLLLLEGGAAFFDRLFARVARATRSIALRCFDWRDDETGELTARALIAAADRGVRVTVLKDLVGATYEYYEGSQQSFLHKTFDWRTRREAMLLRLAYGRLAWPRPRPNPLADAFLAHPNITVEGIGAGSITPRSTSSTTRYCSWAVSAWATPNG